MTVVGRFSVLAVIALALLGAMRAERKPSNECKGNVREGELCNNGTGVCRHVSSGPGEKQGLLECVPTTTSTTTTNTTTTTATTTSTVTTTKTTATTGSGFHCPNPPPENPIAVLTAPGQENGVYDYDAYWEKLYVAPTGRKIKVTMAECQIECDVTAICIAGVDECPFDYIRLFEGPGRETYLCGACACYEYTSTSESLYISFYSDPVISYDGFTAYVTIV